MLVKPNANASEIRVLIVDDHPAVRQGLALLLKSKGFFVCGEVGKRAEALAFIEKVRPNIVLVDLSLGEEDGCVLLKDLQKVHLPSLVYSMYEDGHRVSQAFAAGAHGYVAKSEVHRVLVQAISEVALGGRFVSPKAALALANHAAAAPFEKEISQLSAQEQQVYHLLQDGAATRDIALSMGISPRTVESYCERICSKFCLNGMRELRHFASSHPDNDL